MPTPTQLAKEFAQRLTNRLTPEQMEEVRRRNKMDRDDPAVCHSHDFCDANQYMLDALESLGVEWNPENEKTADLTNSAWSIAKAAGFDPNRVSAKRTIELTVRVMVDTDWSDEAVAESVAFLLQRHHLAQPFSVGIVCVKRVE